MYMKNERMIKQINEQINLTGSHRLPNRGAEISGPHSLRAAPRTPRLAPSAVSVQGEQKGSRRPDRRGWEQQQQWPGAP